MIMALLVSHYDTIFIYVNAVSILEFSSIHLKSACIRSSVSVFGTMLSNTIPCMVWCLCFEVCSLSDFFLLHSLQMLNRNLNFAEGSDPLLYSEKIIECSWDSDKQKWVFKRVRTDKSTPNDFNTYKKVLFLFANSSDF